MDAAAGDRRVLLAVLVNIGLTVGQIVGGLLAGSLALIASKLVRQLEQQGSPKVRSWMALRTFGFQDG